MQQLLQSFTDKFAKAKIPVLRPGYEVRVHQKIKEGNKERVQIFQGVVIAVNSGSSTASTFTVRKVSGGIGVEKTFPVHSPNVTKVEIMRAFKVRRAKLNFIRGLSGRALRFKEVPFELEHKEFEQAQGEALDAEVIEAPEEAEEVATEEPAAEEAPAEETKAE